MNELLGWYGYDKVELRDSDSLEIGETPQHISVLKGIATWFNAAVGLCFVFRGEISTFIQALSSF